MRQYTNQEMLEQYGIPNQTGTYLAYANMPFPLTIAWDTSVTVKRIRCHKLEVANVEDIFFSILDAYGLEKIKALGINLFGGCFNYRAMRGGSSWSRHAWGTAIDLDPQRNQLHQQGDSAQFARREYGEMIDIFEAHGWLSLGRLKNYDWMHFEAGEV